MNWSGSFNDEYQWHKAFAWTPVHTAKRYGTNGVHPVGGRWVWLETIEKKLCGCGFGLRWEYREIGDGEWTRAGKSV